jgi:hypothetical protein
VAPDDPPVPVEPYSTEQLCVSQSSVVFWPQEDTQALRRGHGSVLCMPIAAVAVIDAKSVRAVLDRLVLTQSEFAKFARMPKADVTRVLQGQPVSPERLFRVALALEQLERGLR